jgi:hypothetical protein
MDHLRYSMSFTSGALLYRESLIIAESYRREHDWEAVRATVVRGNLLQMRTANASQRVCREVISRLKLLTPAQLDLLLAGSPADGRSLLWLAFCLRYRFVYDFAVLVLHEKYLRLDLQLDPDEYDRFFARQAEWHAELEQVTPATRAKQRQIVFKTLREAGVADATLHLVPSLLSPALVATITADDPQHFALFPVSQRDIQQWM